jgi:hypothetical protein
MQQMHIGDKWEVYISAEMGYGKFSRPGIPSHSNRGLCIQWNEEHHTWVHIPRRCKRLFKSAFAQYNDSGQELMIIKKNYDIMEKAKVYLAVSIINGKAETRQIAERYFNDFNWRLRMLEEA